MKKAIEPALSKVEGLGLIASLQRHIRKAQSARCKAFWLPAPCSMLFATMPASHMDLFDQPAVPSFNTTSGSGRVRLRTDERRPLRVVMIRICALFLGSLLFFTPWHPVEGADKVRVAVTNPNMSFLPAGVALKRGFFADEGLEVEIIRMNVPNIVTAVMTGDIGYTLLFGSVVRAALRGMPLRALASLLDSPTHALIAKPEYKSVKELRNKTVGIGNFGGTDEVVGRLMFKRLGVDPEKELKIIAVGSDRARLAALKEGLVDVAVIAPPGDALGKQMGFNILARAYEVFSFPFIGIGANLKSIKEKPVEVRKVTKALIRANRYIREDKDGAVKVLMEWGRVERDHALASYDSTWKVFSADGNIPQEGLRLVLEQAKAELKLTKDVPLSEIIDMAPLHEAQKELGIRK